MFEKLESDSQSSCKLIWRILNGIGCLFFLFAAFVNLNDQDWYLWVTIYFATSIFLAIELFNYKSLSIGLIYVNAFVFCLLISFGCQFLLKYQYGHQITWFKHDFLQQEEGRELSGLALASSWLLLILLNRLIRFNSHLSLIIISIGLVLVLVPVGMWSVCFISDDWKERFPQCHSMVSSKRHSHSHFHPTF